jgi:putative hydrolase of the HAD superfamily
MPVRAVLFDFGGTLVSSLRDPRPVFAAAAVRAGVELDLDRYLRANEELWQELWPQGPQWIGKVPSFADEVHERALRRVGAKGSLEAMVRCIREEAISPRWHVPFPESEPVLRQLRLDGRSVHLLSNNVDYLPMLLENLGWSGLFDSVTYSQEIGCVKPDRQLFQLALARAGVGPDQALHVGDSWEADVLGASAAGIPSLWLNREHRAAPGPCKEIQTLRELVPWIANGSRR